MKPIFPGVGGVPACGLSVFFFILIVDLSLTLSFGRLTDLNNLMSDQIDVVAML